MIILRPIRLFLVSALCWGGFGNAVLLADRLAVDAGHDRLGTVAGPIVEISRNTLVIDDEETRTPLRLVYLGDRRPFKVGERVRAYYDRAYGRIVLIKAFTPVSYGPGQNLGVIYRREEK